MTTTPKTQVLVAQDFHASRNMISYILRQIGLRSIEAVKDGGTALSKLKNGDYGIIISDWHMAGIDGLSLLKTVREDPALKDLVFIMVTAENSRDSILEAKESGVDGYVMKPFTAEMLCKRIVAAMKVRYPDVYKAARQQPGKQGPAKDKKPSVKIFGTAAGKPGTSSPQNWSISLSHLSSKPQPVIKDNISAMMRMLSQQFDMMKADSAFISVEEMIGKVETTMANAEQQAEHATLIANTTNEINQALAAVESAPRGSSEAAEGLSVISGSADKLTEMVNLFDKEAADIIGMLNGLEHMVRQVHINEINDTIKASCELEMNPEAGQVIGAGASGNIPQMVAMKLNRIQAGSETAREALTMAAGGITNAIERIKVIDTPVSPSLEAFQKLGGRIERIMDIIDNQAALADTLVSGMKEAEVVKKEVVEPSEPKPAAAAEEVAAAQQPVVPERSDMAPAALKKIINNRILMIDIIKSDHMLCIKKFEEKLQGGADMKINDEEFPGSPLSSLSKWIQRRLEHKDFHDLDVCRKIALSMEEMYVLVVQAFKLYRSGSKNEALTIYQKANARSERIKELLKELQDDLRKKA